MATAPAAGDGDQLKADEAFLERLVAEKPDLLGIANTYDESDIEGPFCAFTQLPLRALNGRTIKPDLILLWRSGHVVVVEVKLADNPELRDRQVVAQLLEYAACLTHYSEQDLFELFGGPNRGAVSWADLIAKLFPDADDPERLARRVFDKIRTSKLDLIIACDEAPIGLRELVKGVVGQSALGEYKFRVVEIAPFVSEAGGNDIVFLPHSSLETEVVARSAVTVNFAPGELQPTVTVDVTPLDDVKERLESPRTAARLQTAATLEEAFKALPDHQKSERLLGLLRWSVEHNCLLTGKTEGAVFGLKGRTGQRIIAVAAEWRWTCYLGTQKYPSIEERDNLIQDLKNFRLYDPDFYPTPEMESKVLTRDLRDLSDDEFERLLAILGKYCGDAKADSSAP